MRRIGFKFFFEIWFFLRFYREVAEKSEPDFRETPLQTAERIEFREI